MCKLPVGDAAGLVVGQASYGRLRRWRDREAPWVQVYTINGTHLLSHPALAELALDRVAAGEGGVEAGDGIGHAGQDASRACGAAKPVHPSRWHAAHGAGAEQAPALKAWQGSPGQVAAAQRVLAHRSRMNSAAARGNYKPAMEQEAI